MESSTVKHTIKAIQNSFGGTVCIHDYSGRIVPLLGREYSLHSDTFCTTIRKNQAGKSLRCPADCLHWTHARLDKTKERFFKVCHMDVCEIVCPVIAGNEVCGAVFFGPFLPGDDFPEESLIETTRKSRLIRSDKTAAGQLQVISYSRANDIMTLARTVTLQISLLISEQSAVSLESLDRNQLIDIFFNQRTDRDVGLDDLAEFLGLSVSRVTQLLKKIKGRSFPELLNETRIDRAKHYLSTSAFTIGHIADIVGFTDQAYMQRVFKKMEGITPGQYRKKHYTQRLV